MTTTPAATNTATALLAAAALLVAGACAEKRLSGKREDVQGFESVRRAKSSSSSTIVLPQPESLQESSQEWRQEQHSALHTPPRLSTPFAWQKLFLIATGKGRTRAQPLQAVPIVAEGRLFAMSTGGSISAFEATTGRKIWRHKLKPAAPKASSQEFYQEASQEFGKGFGGGLAFQDGRVFVSTGLGILAALDGQTGEVLWQQQLPFPLRSAPSVVADTNKALLLVATPTYRTYAFTLDGDMLWQQQSTRDALAQLTLAPSPGVAGRYAVVGYGALLAFAVLPCLPGGEATERKQECCDDLEAVAIPQRAQAVVGERFVDLAEDVAHGMFVDREYVSGGMAFERVSACLFVMQGVNAGCVIRVRDAGCVIRVCDAGWQSVLRCRFT